ncbi:putative transcriptional regulator with HTH domain [Methanococcus maripaludis]|uniref:Putative transcriptional regulator with HTH domain n=1 Tax=Methanococcus maripaludis TaxID=39152 RepID=A0A7J9NXV5_METMI|nr:putative transcriptional regulator with HTH domain [Methanococcus maripaludis]
MNPSITLALNRSKLRKRILQVLHDNQQGMYLSQIARALECQESSILGCLKGMGKRYSADRALVNLGLVNLNVTHGTKIYTLTHVGKTALATL